MSIELTYFGHSAFKIVYGSNTILIDPFLSQNPSFKGSIEDLKPDDILVTHGHSDHLGDSIPISKKTGAIITTMFELANYCEARGAVVNPVGMGSKINFDWGFATFLPASHSSSTPDGSYAGCATSILIQIEDLKIYHAGDTGLHYDLKMIGELHKPDIAILPIGGHFTMGIDEAVQAVKWLNCKNVIPMHYDTFPPIRTNVADFKVKTEVDTDSKCIILRSGESVRF
jgi:L-ascorbate metabolism protein UlaG (beta-lactamase superfamily)